MIFHTLDWDGAAHQGKLVWMPAHKSSGHIGSSRKSDGTTISQLDWRANRLVDVLAKSAAGFDRVSRATLSGVSSAASACEYSLAKLGVVTKACNNHLVPVVHSDGSE